MSPTKWERVEHFVARTHSVTALDALMRLRGGNVPAIHCSHIWHDAPYALSFDRPGLRLATDNCVGDWRIDSRAARSRLAWLWKHPAWIAHRLPADRSEGLVWTLRRRPFGSPPWLGAIRQDIHRALNLPRSTVAASGDSLDAETRLDIVRHAVGLTESPPRKEGRSSEGRDRLRDCYLGPPSWRPPLRLPADLPPGCPLGHVRIGVVNLPGRGWVVDRPGDPWPGPRPWATKKASGR